MTETYTTEDFLKAMGGGTLTAYSTGSETYTPRPARSDEFRRFEDLVSRLIAVPKTEIGEAERQP
jgi:hypothetical protein